ncbi:MAG TPA: TIGR01212 family radical SAM protein [Candidatus Bariatricus faecipullorum]|nr:TIGR01212 family radical SAM protein [Candidatus Bariatricus faecipullorum]
MRLYYPYSQYLKEKYHGKVYKLPVCLPVTCPNRTDGTGCAFCAGAGTGFEAQNPEADVTEQLQKAKEKIGAKYHPDRYLAYFQNYTNTFLPVEQFAAYIREAAEMPELAGISISTRPDCVHPSYLDVLRQVQTEKGLGISIELGLQTANYHTLAKINRGHSLGEYIDAVLQIKQYPGFEICTHVILNLPWDGEEDAVETAKIITALGTDVVKLHSLYIARGTEFARWYEEGRISICTKEEYFRRVILFLEHIPEDMAVERLFARIPEKESLFCNWGESWWKLRDELLAQMEKEGTWQGRLSGWRNGAALKKLPGLTGEC